MKELIARINELYHKRENEGLTPEETEEQGKLRRQYIDNVKQNFQKEIGKVKKVDSEPC
jgi:5-formyltetrahydrofolate cyclo-ligase